MTCRHFRPHLEIAHRVGSVGTSQTADACDLLVPWNRGHKDTRRALRSAGFMCAPTPFDCPVAAEGRWRACPFFVEGRPDAG